MSSVWLIIIGVCVLLAIILGIAYECRPRPRRPIYRDNLPYGHYLLLSSREPDDGAPGVICVLKKDGLNEIEVWLTSLPPHVFDVYLGSKSSRGNHRYSTSSRIETRTRRVALVPE